MKLLNLSQLVSISADYNKVTFSFSNGDSLVCHSEKYDCNNDDILHFIRNFVKKWNDFIPSHTLQASLDAIIEDEFEKINSEKFRNILYLNTAGHNNNFKGTYPGRYFADCVTANQTSNNSVFLGYNTKSKQAGQTNETVIDNDAIGNGCNTIDKYKMKQ